MKKQPELIHIGTFEVADDSLRVSDPCYDRSTWCAGNIQNPKQGIWNVYVLFGECGWGDRRPWELVAIHESYPQSLTNKMTEDSGIDVGVDSGLAGIFSDSKFLGGKGGGWGSGGWFDECCSKILHTKYSAGVVEGGCVSMSGYGDGGYSCFVAHDGTSEIVGAKIVYITKDEEDLDW
jgi:hypothetical protein